jgi:hypothetical protein
VSISIPASNSAVGTIHSARRNYRILYTRPYMNIHDCELCILLVITNVIISGSLPRSMNHCSKVIQCACTPRVFPMYGDVYLLGAMRAYTPKLAHRCLALARAQSPCSGYFSSTEDHWGEGIRRVIPRTRRLRTRKRKTPVC